MSFTSFKVKVGKTFKCQKYEINSNYVLAVSGPLKESYQRNSDEKNIYLDNFRH